MAKKNRASKKLDRIETDLEENNLNIKHEKRELSKSGWLGVMYSAFVGMNIATISIVAGRNDKVIVNSKKVSDCMMYNKAIMKKAVDTGDLGMLKSIDYSVKGVLLKNNPQSVKINQLEKDVPQLLQIYGKSQMENTLVMSYIKHEYKNPFSAYMSENTADMIGGFGSITVFAALCGFCVVKAVERFIDSKGYKNNIKHYNEEKKKLTAEKEEIVANK